MVKSAGRLVKQYVRERDAVLRALDEDRLDAHHRKWDLPGRASGCRKRA